MLATLMFMGRGDSKADEPSIAGADTTAPETAPARTIPAAPNPVVISDASETDSEMVFDLEPAVEKRAKRDDDERESRRAKREKKEYRYYTGYLRGLKTEKAGSLLERRPEKVIELAVRRMLPKSTMGKMMLKKLRVFGGDEHPHAAQRPEPLSVG